MKKHLTRFGRLSLTLVTIATVMSLWALNSCKSVSETFAMTFFAALGAIAVAMLIDEYAPVRRIRRRIA